MENLKVLLNRKPIQAPLLKAIKWKYLLKYDQKEFETFIWAEWFFLHKNKETSTSQKLYVQVTTFDFKAA